MTIGFDKRLELIYGIIYCVNKDQLVYIASERRKKKFFEYYMLNIDIDVIQKEEVESVKWYTVDEINKLIEEDKVRPGNIPAFKKVLEYKNKVK